MTYKFIYIIFFFKYDIKSVMLVKFINDKMSDLGNSKRKLIDQ